MPLKVKFIILIALIVGCSFGVTFYRTANFQEELVVAQATRQAKMLFQQIRITRQWIADHNGLFLVKGPGVEENPFLADGQVQDQNGNWLVKRNPAMVTRELSIYAAREGIGQFNVTSLKPMNPDNGPDTFEHRSLQDFSAGVLETVEIEEIEGKHRLRYMAPLQVDEQCLQCHATQDYEVGDIRGGMSVSIPMNWAYAEIKANNRLLLNIGVTTIIIVSFCIYLLFNFLVSKRLSRLAGIMDQYPDKPMTNNFSENGPNDEIGLLNEHFRKLCRRLETSQQELNTSREQVFQSEKQAALGRLVAGISHEINNPLGGMQNCIQTMQRHMDQPELQSRYMTLLGQGIEKIKGTVQQLLNIGRQEPLETKQGDIDQAIRDCLELSCLGHKNIQVELQLGIHQTVMTGIESLRQVMMNLAGNAVQSIGTDQGTIKVISQLDSEKIYIECSDTGSGIDPEHLDKIFEPFFTTKEVGQGTGLGLSVSDSLIKRLGGSISVKNNPDGGACFTLIIPLQQPITVEKHK